jgi:hypothetical protein
MGMGTCERTIGSGRGGALSFRPHQEDRSLKTNVGLDRNSLRREATVQQYLAAVDILALHLRLEDSRPQRPGRKGVRSLPCQPDGETRGPNGMPSETRERILLVWAEIEESAEDQFSEIKNVLFPSRPPAPEPDNGGIGASAALVKAHRNLEP